jgi:hypothetical protein
LDTPYSKAYQARVQAMHDLNVILLYYYILSLQRPSTTEYQLATPQLGPSLKATICTQDIDLSVAAWCNSLHQQIHQQGQLTPVRALQLGHDDLAGAERVVIANELGDPWLEFIENPDAVVVDPFSYSGWFSLEINVQDVDALRADIDESVFQVIGEPANLEMSDNIRAMQLVGPAGEVLYLTEIKGPVPPFELPTARCIVDRLFIPVLLTENRDVSLQNYLELHDRDGLKFETKITVINNARGHDIDTRNPVAALQLAGSNLIEMDQVAGLKPRTYSGDITTAGISVISFASSSLPTGLDTYQLEDGPHAGSPAVLVKGAAGELIELIQTNKL